MRKWAGRLLLAASGFLAYWLLVAAAVLAGIGLGNALDLSDFAGSLLIAAFAILGMVAGIWVLWKAVSPALEYRPEEKE